MVVLFLLFWETSILFFTVAAPIYIPSNSVQGFCFFPHPCQHVLFVLFVCVCVVAILIGVRWYLSVVPLAFQFLISHLRFLKLFSQFSFGDFLCLGFLQSFPFFLAPFFSLIFWYMFSVNLCCIYVLSPPSLNGNQF